MEWESLTKMWRQDKLSFDYGVFYVLKTPPTAETVSVGSGDQQIVDLLYDKAEQKSTFTKVTYYLLIFNFMVIVNNSTF